MAGSVTGTTDAEALGRVLAVVPIWDGLVPAVDVMGSGRALLHAGPPIANPGRTARPILNSAALAAVYEGWCATPDDGEAMILGRQIALVPAQQLAIVVPLAGVVSPSMILQRVRDRAVPQRVAWSPFNGGMGPAMRLGLRDLAVVEHWRWLNGPFAEALAAALSGGVDLIAIARHGLGHGDDCHGRTHAATAQLASALQPAFDDDGDRTVVLTYLDAAPAFFLNLWMAATKCMLQAAEGTTGSALITAMAGNGIDAGIQIAGLPGRWFTAPAAPPEGAIQPPYTQDDRLGTIGDSAIVDAFGLGAMAFSFAPEQQMAMAGNLPADAMALPEMLLLARHPAFGGLDLLVGQSAARIAALDRTGIVSLGILDMAGKGGRIGGGIYRPPASLFRAASEALKAR